VPISPIHLEHFSNGVTIISLYLRPLPNSSAPPIENSIHQIMKEASLIYCLPDNPFFARPDAGGAGHAVQEATYACKTFPPRSLVHEASNLADTSISRCIDCGWIFAQHFCNRLGPAYLALRDVLDENNPTHAEVLNNIKRRFREETFTREAIADVIHAHPELVRSLYVHFAMAHYPKAEASRLMYASFLGSAHRTVFC
jgi:glutamate dehydrogenase